MIDREHALPITRQAQLLGISRGAVYYLPRAISQTDLTLMRRIDELHLEHPFMGARMLRRQLAREDVRVGRRHIATLMCVFRTIVTDRFGIVTAEFGNVTGHFGDVTEGHLIPA
jgi:hypothetical protein